MDLKGKRLQKSYADHVPGSRIVQVHMIVEAIENDIPTSDV
jgi:hypothetical protein